MIFLDEYIIYKKYIQLSNRKQNQYKVAYIYICFFFGKAQNNRKFYQRIL